MPIETKHTDAGMAVVAVSGRLVIGKEIEKLETVVKELVQKGQKQFVFDLTALDYADSSGIGTFVSCLTTIRKSGGELRMAGVSPRIQRLFHLTGVENLMSCYPTVADAAAGGK
jgi:anti-sigma B factor antagonist